MIRVGPAQPSPSLLPIRAEDVVPALRFEEVAQTENTLANRHLAQPIRTTSPTTGSVLDLTLQETQATDTEPGPSTLSKLCNHLKFPLIRLSQPRTNASVKETDAGTSASARSPHVPGILSKVKKECTACTELVVARVITDCGHEYCIRCMKQMFQQSTQDEALFPPRCCKQNIPLSLIVRHMTEKERKRYVSARLEFTTINRVYCSTKGCKKFIPPHLIDSVSHEAMCSSCSKSTCSLCKDAYHKLTHCFDDPEILQTRALARSKGWQTCYQCSGIVELSVGCHHIKCRCGAHFCYVCGKKWKTCDCRF